ncbi:MAG: Vacuolar protein sorting-associated protein 5 [Piccolia ochrophora]|nr:MAG: Vacuolar protein sorting-associated protein 5 [Piccolia ochrophora]
MDLEDEGWGDVPSRPHSAQKLPEESADDAFTAPDTPSATSSQTQPAAPPSGARSPTGRGQRASRRVAAQATKLEAIDDSLGPLGPLGDQLGSTSQAHTDPPPAPPVKERVPIRSAQPLPHAPAIPHGGARPPSPTEADLALSGNARTPPPVSPPTSSAPQQQRQSQPSVSIEQAANPTFDIAVGDPHKVGDLTSSHIVYQVRTRTSSKAYRQPEFTVSRRYRDFLWLYNQLHSNNPGVVVPPPPEKQAVGRFDTGFVESRRAALERMLNKSAAHPVLQLDGDLKLFLESDSFTVDIKHKEKKDLGLAESKGMFSSMGFSVGSTGKFIEHDDWFHDRKIYLDALESQLKMLLKAIDTVVRQRKELSEAAGDFSASLRTLSTVELSAALSGPLDGLAALQLRIQELYERQAQQDVLTLGITVDEYIRLIGSIKQAFLQRQKAFHSWHAAESELQKRKATQDKLLRQGKSQQDRLNQVSADVGDAERRVHQTRLLFDDMGRLMRGELERFEKEKVEDFKSGVETFLESAVEAQKELIELWETYLMQLDADEDGQQPNKPPLGTSTVSASNNDSQPLFDERSVETAPTATLEQEV